MSKRSSIVSLILLVLVSGILVGCGTGGNGAGRGLTGGAGAGAGAGSGAGGGGAGAGLADAGGGSGASAGAGSAGAGLADAGGGSGAESGAGGIPLASGRKETVVVSDRIKITKLPMTVEKKVFDKGLREPGTKLEEHNQYANTTWYFYSKPKFDFEIVSRNEKDFPKFATNKKGTGTESSGTNNESKKTVSVKLLIKKVDVELSLPITIWFPEGANEEVIAHENGHVAICERLYRDAVEHARTAALKVAGQTFEGQGDSLNNACQMALNAASMKLGRLYGEKTSDVVNQVSRYYDKLTPQHPEPKFVSAAVTAAFELRERVQSAGGDIEKAFDKSKAPVSGPPGLDKSKAPVSGSDSGAPKEIR